MPLTTANTFSPIAPMEVETEEQDTIDVDMTAAPQEQCQRPRSRSRRPSTPARQAQDQNDNMLLDDAINANASALPQVPDHISSPRATNIALLARLRAIIDLHSAQRNASRLSFMQALLRLEATLPLNDGRPTAIDIIESAYPAGQEGPDAIHIDFNGNDAITTRQALASLIGASINGTPPPVFAPSILSAARRLLDHFTRPATSANPEQADPTRPAQGDPSHADMPDALRVDAHITPEMIADHPRLLSEVPTHYVWTFIKSTDQVLDEYVQASQARDDSAKHDAISKLLLLPAALLPKPSSIDHISAPRHQGPTTDLNRSVRQAQEVLRMDFDALMDGVGMRDRYTGEINPNAAAYRPAPERSRPPPLRR
jgi:hypothetical protein